MATGYSTPCAHPDCDESAFGFQASDETRPDGTWLCPGHRPSRN